MTPSASAERSPTVAGWELAVRLKAKRLATGTSVDAITSTLGFSRPYWSAIENTRTLPSPDKLRELVDLLGFDNTEAEELLALRELARRRSWWNERVPERLQRYLGLEQGAQGQRTYEASIVTGLLQTADYVRALASASPFVKAVDIDAVVSLRQRRQELLAGPEALRLTTVMSQAVLLQHVGPPEVLLGQLRHLIDVIENRSTSIEVRIAPFDRSPAGIHTNGSTIYLLDFASPHLPTVVWGELANEGLLLDEPEATLPFVVGYEQALDAALTREESLELIEATARELEGRI